MNSNKNEKSLCQEPWYVEILTWLNPEHPKWKELQQTMINPISQNLIRNYVLSNWEMIQYRLMPLQQQVSSKVIREIEKTSPNVPLVLKQIQQIQNADQFMSLLQNVFSMNENPIRSGTIELGQLLQKPEMCFFFFYRQLLDLPLRKKNIETWIQKLPSSSSLFETFFLFRLGILSKIPSTMSPLLQNVFRKWIVAQTCSIHHVQLQPFIALQSFPEINETSFVRKWKKTMIHSLEMMVKHVSETDDKSTTVRKIVSGNSNPTTVTNTTMEKQEPVSESAEKTGMTGLFSWMLGEQKGGKKQRKQRGGNEMPIVEEEGDTRNADLYTLLNQKVEPVHSPKYQPLLQLEQIPLMEGWLGWVIQPDKTEWNQHEWNFDMFERRVRWYQSTSIQTLQSLYYLLENQTFKSYQDILFFYFTLGFPIEYEFPFFVYLLQSQQGWKRDYQPFPVPANNGEQYAWFLASCLYYLHENLGSSFVRHLYAFYKPEERFSLESFLNQMEKKSNDKNSY